MRSKILVPIEALQSLYLEQGLSPAAIARIHGCTSVTIRARLLEAGIPLRSKSAAQNRYAKYDFNGSEVAKAYMLGFRYGDLNVFQPKGASQTIVVRSHTTHQCQEFLFTELFGDFGKITTSRNNRTIHSNAYLNMSFSFLLGKYNGTVRKWLHESNQRLRSFAAGYIDAEGTFGLNQGKGRFKMDAYDQDILSDLHDFFVREGVRSKMRIIARKGENDYGWVWKKDLWRVSVNEAGSLEKFIQSLSPYLRHQKRIADVGIVLSNINQRRKNGTIK